MSDLDVLLKPYTCHKKVRAAQITSVGNYVSNHAGALVRSVTIANDLTIELPDEMFVRYVPSPGDFLVVYEGGYQSFSPRKQFLEGYTADGESFSDIKQGLRIKSRSPGAGTNTGDGVALSSASHPSDEELN